MKDKKLPKSKSQSQRRLMGWAYACKTDKTENCPENIQALGDSMKIEELESMAKTKTKNKPERIAKTFEQFLLLTEKQWKSTLKLKDLLTSDDLVDEQQIITLCNSVVNRLERLKKRFVGKDEEFELEDIIDNFKHIISLADGTIKEDEFEDYSFDGDFTELFNEYLEQLYDFADYNDIWIE